MKELIKEIIIKIDIEKYERSLKNICDDINPNIINKKKELLKELLNNEKIYTYHLNLYDKEIYQQLKRTYS